MTLISRPRLWTTVLLAALSLTVLVTLRVRRSDAQDEPIAKPSPKAKTTDDTVPTKSQPKSDDELLSGPKPLAPTPRRSVFIEIRLDEESEAIHKLVDKLIKAGSVKRLPLDATQTTRIDYTAVIAARADLKFERVGQLVNTLKALGVGKVQFGQAAGDTNSVRVTAPPHVTPQILQNFRTELAKYDDFEADVLVARGIRGPKGHIAVPISKRTTEIEKALKNCDVVTIAIGTRNLLLSIFENTDKPQLAKKIFEATKGNADIELFVLDDHLLINTPQKDFNQPDVQDGGKIAQAVIAALMGGADDANTKTPEAGVGGSFGGGGFGEGVSTTGGLFGSGLGGGGQAGSGGSANPPPQITILFSNDVVAIPKEAIGSRQLIQGGNLAIIASNKHDMLWGYSEPLGKWFKQPVTLDVEGLIPIIGGQVAAVTPAYKTKPDKKTFFVFSSATGRWGTIEMSLNASEPAVYAKMVVVTDGETTHVFKNDTGKWSTPTALVADNERSTAPKPSPKSKHPNAPTAEFASRPPHPYAPPLLSYSDGQEVYLVDLDSDGVLDVVPADETKSSRPDENHSIVGAWQMVRETTAKRREMAEERAAFQESLGPQHPALAQINGRLLRLEEDEQEWRSRLKAFAAPASFGRVTVIDWQSRLKSDLQQAEQDAEQAAREVKSPKNSRDKDQAQVRLRESVGKAFASRQKLQQLEAELLRERLRQVDDRLQERGRLRDRIIQRRVEELTDSNLDWRASEPLDLSKVDEPRPLTISAEVVTPKPSNAALPAVAQLPSVARESTAPRFTNPPEIEPPPETIIATVNSEPITDRALYFWGVSQDDLEPFIKLILLKQAAEKADIEVSSQDLRAEVQRRADTKGVSLDEFYETIGRDLRLSRPRYRELVLWPELVLKRLAGDDVKQHLKYREGLRAAAKIELVDPDAKLRPIKTESGETDQPKEPPPANNENAPASANNDPLN